MAGQGTVAVEILNDCEDKIDYVFGSIGGGGLMSGLSTYMNGISPDTKMIGVEPSGAASMKNRLKIIRLHHLHSIDSFVDGAAVALLGRKHFPSVKNY